MKPIDFKDQKPRLIIEDYLSGNVKAWGILQNRSGKVTRQFSADLNGNGMVKQLILDEKFNWSDGEVQKRQWKINKIDEHNYEGTAGDVVGYGQRLFLWTSILNLNMFYWFLLKERRLKLLLMIGFLNKMIKLLLIELL